CGGHAVSTASPCGGQTFAGCQSGGFTTYGSTTYAGMSSGGYYAGMSSSSPWIVGSYTPYSTPQVVYSTPYITGSTTP
ncbi:hypothetical protein ACEV9B_23985, partial [Vibrio parahaemolyticus]